MTTATARATGTALLLASYVGTIIAANWASSHWPALPVESLVVPAGTLWAVVTFTLRDLLHDALGARAVAIAIAMGAGLSWVLASPQIAVSGRTYRPLASTARAHHPGQDMTMWTPLITIVVLVLLALIIAAGAVTLTNVDCDRAHRALTLLKILLSATLGPAVYSPRSSA